jgi:hypothetical protein
MGWYFALPGMREDYASVTNVVAKVMNSTIGVQSNSGWTPMI